jgi:hypothetical protein
MAGFQKRSVVAEFPTTGAQNKVKSVGAYLRVGIRLNQGEFPIGQIPLFNEKDLDQFLMEQEENLDQGNWSFEINLTNDVDLNTLSFDLDAETQTQAASKGYLNVFVETTIGKRQVGGIQLDAQKKVDYFLLSNAEKVASANWYLSMYKVKTDKQALAFA